MGECVHNPAPGGEWLAGNPAAPCGLSRPTTMTTIAINGFGRIGRLVFRALVEQGHLGTTFNVVAVGDIVPADNLAYLLKYDSTQGKFNGTVGSKKSAPDKAEDDVLIV